MKNFYDEESRCSTAFYELGKCFHLWTSERCETIFCEDDDFRSGMNVIGVCARLHPKVKILTFEIMSNHLHFTVAGDAADNKAFFDSVKNYLARCFKKLGKTIDWSGFNANPREITTLDDLRNVLVYNNRNGYVVSKNHTPFTYPWGANRYYFNPDAVSLASLLSRPMTQRERQTSICSRVADHVEGLLMYDDCVSPLSFCDIASGEKLFRDSSSYFYKLGRSIENQKQIALEIKESIFYTDDELFSAITSVARKRFEIKTLNEANSLTKVELARIMRYEYNASVKQIMRFLKLPQDLLASIGIS